MTKSITLYSNKGGVSKTTTTFNIAVYLSNELKKKVLIIDADPQCNITELFFANQEEYLADTERELPGTSILDVFRPRFYGESPKINVANIILNQSNIYENLYLLRGDIEFSASGEQYFANSIQQAITNNVNEKNTFVAFRRLVDELGQSQNFDYILVDVGPSSGAITRQAFLSCDMFIIPVTLDRFSYIAISVLATLYKDWTDQDEKIYSTFQPFGIDLSPKKPVFIGSINQNFKGYKDKMKGSYEKWYDKISSALKANVINNPDVLKAVRLCDVQSPFIASIKDLGALAPVSQITGKAIFELKQPDSSYATDDGQMYYGAVWDNWVNRMNDYKNEIKKIVSAIDAL